MTRPTRLTNEKNSKFKSSICENFMFLKVNGIPKRSYPENKISKPSFTKAKDNTVHINRKARILLKVNIIAHNKNAAGTEDHIPQTAVRRIRPKLNLLAHHTSERVDSTCF